MEHIYTIFNRNQDRIPPVLEPIIKEYIDHLELLELCDMLKSITIDIQTIEHEFTENYKIERKYIVNRIMELINT